MKYLQDWKYIMVRKAFDEQLYADNDTLAKATVASAFNRDGLYCRVNDDLYGPDLCVYLGYKHKYFVECEIKRVWAGGETFPWETIQIPHRKEKLINGTTKPVEFWVLSADLKWAVIIPEEVIVASPVVEVPNRLVSTGELFYQVPVSQCIIRKL